MKQIPLLTVTLLSLCAGALAKLPPLSDEAKAKAAEAAAKAAWSGKVGAYELCQVQDRIAGNYRSSAGSASAAASTPVSTPPCADPGKFVYSAQGGAAPPLEASGAHSPAKTATAPPSSSTPEAEQKSSKK